MNKRLGFFLTLLALWFTAGAQTNTLTICIDVQASAGGSAQMPDGYYAWTLGETMIETYQSGLTLTQGFHQPKCGHAVDTIDATSETTFGLPVRVYPNPTTGLLTIAVSPDPSNPGGRFHVTVYDLFGKPLLESSWSDYAAAAQQIDCTFLPAGVWLLRVSDVQTQHQAVVRFIKID